MKTGRPGWKGRGGPGIWLVVPGSSAASGLVLFHPTGALQMGGASTYGGGGDVNPHLES